MPPADQPDDFSFQPVESTPSARTGRNSLWHPGQRRGGSLSEQADLVVTVMGSSPPADSTDPLVEDLRLQGAKPELPEAGTLRDQFFQAHLQRAA